MHYFTFMSMFLKRIFCFYLPLVLFTACSDSDDSRLAVNPVLGVWNNYAEKTDSLQMTRVFTSDFYSYFTFAEGKVQHELNKQRYIINETHIILDKYTQSYTLKDDTLWILNQKADQVTKYIKAY